MIFFTLIPPINIAFAYGLFAGGLLVLSIGLGNRYSAVVNEICKTLDGKSSAGEANEDNFVLVIRAPSPVLTNPPVCLKNLAFDI